MSLYTPQARAAVGGVSQIEVTIQAAVDNANTAFIDSNMVARYVLVHTSEAAYNDSGDSGLDLNWISSDPGVAALRDQYAADMVSLIPEDGGGFCGRGYVQRNPGPGFASSAFQVTARSCAVGNLSFAHEHGHNMGFEHDPANGTSSSNASYPYAFGHFVSGSYRTVMSYSNPCSGGCTRVAHHSNPDILNAGVPTGISDQRDNARAGDQTAPIVANFRLATAAVCGNGVLDAGEGCDGSDLGGASCSDLGCGSGAVTCASDCTLDYSICSACPQCDFDGVCEAGEDCGNCASDCSSGSGASCGNGVCEAGDGEDCLSCPEDCNGKTGGKPSTRFCCGDGNGPNPAGAEDPRCTTDGFQCTDILATGSCCGDGACTGFEDGSSCSLDCGAPSTCGDGICDPGETSCSCDLDCGAPPTIEWLTCGDGVDNDCDGVTDCADGDCDGDDACTLTCEPAGAYCTSRSDCCTGSCKGPRGRKTCRS